MIMRRYFLSVVAFFAFFGQAVANEKMTVLLDWFVNPDHGPLIIARENGILLMLGWKLGCCTSRPICTAKAGSCRTGRHCD